MRLINKSNKKDQMLFKEMYFNYTKELSQYSKRIQKNPVTDYDFKQIINNSLLKCYFITNEINLPIGFCLIGFGENTQPGTDWYIAEFYILPSFRKKKYGEAAIIELTQTHPGKYCYFVLKANTGAKNFWNKTIKKLKFIDISLEYNAKPYTPEDCIFYAFKTK